MRSTIGRTVLSLGGAVWLGLGLARAADAQPATPINPQPSTAVQSSQGASQGLAQNPSVTPAAAELSVVTRLDKTAVWVGDQFHYQIFVEHSPRLQFILDNLNKDTINLDPLSVVAVASSTTQLKNGNHRLFVDLTLANFTVGVPELQIPQLTLFYFRREGVTAAALTAGAAAESLTIRGPVIAVRSTLPPGQSDLRDAVTVTGWPRSRWIVAGIGWCALALLIGGVGTKAVQMIRVRKREGPGRGKLMAAIRDRWSQSVPANFDDADVVFEFYGRSYRDLKEYLGYLLDTHAEGLTADEIRVEMSRLTADPGLTDRAGKVFEICETARYARHGTALNVTAARAVADNIQEIFKVSSRV